MMGADIVGGSGDEGTWGGVPGVSKGLDHEHPHQMIDTPLSESAHVGAAVAEPMSIDLIGVCLDRLLSRAAKCRRMFGGKAQTPVVIRAMCGAGFRRRSTARCRRPRWRRSPG